MAGGTHGAEAIRTAPCPCTGYEVDPSHTPRKGTCHDTAIPAHHRASTAGPRGSVTDAGVEGGTAWRWSTPPARPAAGGSGRRLSPLLRAAAPRSMGVSGVSERKSISHSMTHSRGETVMSRATTLDPGGGSRRAPAEGHRSAPLSLTAAWAGTHGSPGGARRVGVRAASGWTICGMRTANRCGGRQPRAIEILSSQSGDRRYAWPSTST